MRWSSFVMRGSRQYQSDTILEYGVAALSKVTVGAGTECEIDNNMSLSRQAFDVLERNASK